MPKNRFASGLKPAPERRPTNETWRGQMVGRDSVDPRHHHFRGSTENRLLYLSFVAARQMAAQSLPVSLSR